jgi:chromosome segregation ATPase
MGVMDVTTTARPLDRRRDKAGTASAAAAAADAAVTDIDRQLETLSSLTEQQQGALRRAAEETERLKRSLKAAGKRRAELAKERKKAVAKAEQARAKADLAEAKYDKEVLAELVRREKEKDRAAGAPSARSPRRAAADPPPEKPDEATQSARRTAARKTAKAARLIR